jgi:hypothetical protein
MLTEKQYLDRTLSPDEWGNRFAIEQQRSAYRAYRDRVLLYGEPDIEPPKDSK